MRHPGTDYYANATGAAHRQPAKKIMLWKKWTKLPDDSCMNRIGAGSSSKNRGQYEKNNNNGFCGDQGIREEATQHGKELKSSRWKRNLLKSFNGCTVTQN
jgi:hypothetical protein